MNIASTSLSSVTSIGATSSVSQIQSTDSTSSTGSTESTESSKTRLSKLGEMMSKLQDLEKTDPAKAKQVLTSIASTLSDKASTSNDPRLKELADQFTAAAKTGDLSGLKPSGPPPGGHHGGHHGPPPPSSDDASSSATTATSATQSGQVARYSQTEHAQRIDLASIVSDALSSAGA
jgi:hypothetical protein